MLTPFEKWAKTFQDKPARIYTGLGKETLPVHKMLARFHKIKLARLDVETLQLNVLHACYQAKFSSDPNADGHAKERQALLDSHKKLAAHTKEARAVLGYLTQYDGVPKNAMSAAVANPASNWPKTQITAQGSKKVEELKHLLGLYVDGLQSAKPPRLLHVPIGPLELTLSKHKWHGVIDIRQIGLMFHLAYLFRYATVKTLPGQLDIRDVGNGVLEIYGPMLKGGDPHTHLVAPLVNATFEKTKFKSEKVRDLLNDLSRLTKGANFPKRAQFIGWAPPK